MQKRLLLIPLSLNSFKILLPKDALKLFPSCEASDGGTANDNSDLHHSNRYYFLENRTFARWKAVKRMKGSFLISCG